MSKIGLIAELTKKQTNRAYFQDIPIGTKFIITAEHDDDSYYYDLTGYFLYTIPQIYSNNTGHFTGYIEKGSWKVIGDAKEFFKELNDKNYELES